MRFDVPSIQNAIDILQYDFGNHSNTNHSMQVERILEAALGRVDMRGTFLQLGAEARHLHDIVDYHCRKSDGHLQIFYCECSVASRSLAVELMKGESVKVEDVKRKSLNKSEVTTLAA